MENPSLLEQLRLPGDIKDLSLDQPVSYTHLTLPTTERV